MSGQNNDEMSILLEAMLQSGASDLHLKAGSPPGLRIDGQIHVLQDCPRLTPEDTVRLARAIIPPDRVADYEQGHDLDFAFSHQGVSRYRVSLTSQRGSAGIVLRRVPVEVPDFDRLGLPTIARSLATLPRGLVLVTGPTGSGKSTTLAAIIDFLNRTTQKHIITLEDPIEFVHADKKCFITQREIGVDCSGFQPALRRALRQDPDIIMIGELRDKETISLAVTAAETGHLVFATLHTTGAVQTVDRIIDAFPSTQQGQVRVQLSGTLQAIISQTLVKKTSGGRAAAFEVLVATEAIRNCVREGKTAQITSLMQTGTAVGMQTLDASLSALVRGGVITQDEGQLRATSPENFQRALLSGGFPLRALPRTPLQGTSSSQIPGPVHAREDRAVDPLPAEPVRNPLDEPVPDRNSDLLRRLRSS